VYQSGVEDPVYYKAVDKNGNKVSFYDDNGNEIKYTVIMNSDGTPYLERTNGESPIDSGKQTTDGYTYSIIGISFNDYKRIALKNVKGGKYLENIDNLPNLNNQAYFISRVVISLRKAVEEKDITETDNMKNFREYINSVCNTTYSSFSDITDNNVGEKIIAKLKENIKNGSDYAQVWTIFESEVNKITTDLQKNQFNMESKYYSKRQNLVHYVLANERTYTLQGTEGGAIVSLFGWIPKVGDAFILLDSGIRSIWPTDQEYYGMLHFGSEAFNWNNGSPQKGNFDVSIDRENNEMLITTKSGFLGTKRDQMKWDLSGWTSRYGKPIELSLALHLSTMAPDFVYDFCANQNLQTSVNIQTDHITYKYSYQYHTAGGKTIKDTEIKSAMEEINKNKLEDVNQVFNIDETEIKQYDGYQYSFGGNEIVDNTVLPYEVLDSTSIIYVKYGATNGEEKLYKVLYKGTKTPVSFFSDPVTPGNHDYKIELIDGVPYFTDVGNVGKIDDETDDIITLSELLDRNHGFHKVNVDGKEISVRLEVLSLRDVAAMINNVGTVATQITGERNNSTQAEIDKINQKALVVIGNSIKGENDGTQKLEYINGKHYRRILYVWDDLINEEQSKYIDFQGIFASKYRERGKKLGLSLELNHYNFNEDTGKVSVNKITFNNYDSLSQEMRKHNSEETWVKLTEYIKSKIEESTTGKLDLNIYSILSYNGGQDSFIKSVIDELSQIKAQEFKKNQNGYVYLEDENYLKLLAIYSDGIESKLAEWGIDYDMFFKLYYAFKDLATEAETYRPYIYSVTNHWYKDLYFDKTDDEKGVYSFEKISPKIQEFNPEGTANTDNIKFLNDKSRGQIYYEEKTDNKVRIQVEQPRIVKTKSWHYMVKNWIVYGYYFIYEGQQQTAKKIEQALDILKDDYDPTNPLLIEVTDQEGLYKGNISSDEIDKKAKQLNQKLRENGSDVTLQKINFEKKSSLQAFSILEAMHTEDSEYIYRDLKEFLIELGYFTRADFESIETDVFKWIIQGYNVYKDEWPDLKYEKNNNEYGTYIRSQVSLDEQREKEAKEAKDNKENTGGKTSYTTTGVGYNRLTTVNGITYKNYKQGDWGVDTNGYSQAHYWDGTIATSGCGPTSVAILLSGYGKDVLPDKVGEMMDDLDSWYGAGTKSSKMVDVLKNKFSISAKSYDVSNGKSEAIKNISNALKEGKPVLVSVPGDSSGRYSSGAHWMCITGFREDGTSIYISNPGRSDSSANGNYCESIEEFVNNYQDNASIYVIPDKAPTGVITTNEIVGFKSGQNVIMPETGVIKKIGTREKEDNNKEKTQTKDNTDYFKTNGEYIRIEFNTNNGVNGWKMEIEGLTIDANIQEGDKLNKGDTIGTTNTGNIKIILYDEKDAIINNVEDYFKLQARKKSNSGTAGSLEDLGVMILTMEGGMDSNSDGDYWIVIEGNGSFEDRTAGGSGVTNSCKEDFFATGHGDLYPMQVGDRVPKQAILEVKAHALESHYKTVESYCSQLGANLNEAQKQALTSLAYNTGDGPVKGIIETYASGDTDKAKWEFLNLCHADGKTLLGLQYRRAVEWDIFENGANYEYTEERKQECYTKYYTNFYYTRNY
jgi:GH24 family phage-related lysozyme (muramidase)